MRICCSNVICWLDKTRHLMNCNRQICVFQCCMEQRINQLIEKLSAGEAVKKFIYYLKC